MSWHELMLHLLLFLHFSPRYHSQQIPNDAMPYPQFFLQPQKQSVKREMTSTIDCGAYGGIGTLTYTYYKGATPQYNMMSKLKTVAPDPDTLVASYFIPTVSTEDAGYYQCVVSDGAGVVIYSNVIYLHVVDNYLTRGDTINESRLLLSTARIHVLNCTMPVSNPPALPRWFKDGTPIDQNDKNMFVSHGVGSIEGAVINIGDLVMFSLNYTHSGMYTCAGYNYLLEEAANQIDVVYYNVTVGTSGDIGEFSSLEAIVSDLTVNVGSEGYLFCAGVGNPAPSTEFLTVSPALDGISSQSNRLVTVPASLITAPNSYYSTCRVGNSYYTARLVVVEPPINSVDSVTFQDDATSPIVYYIARDTPPRSLSCDTTDDENVAKQWFKNGLVWNMGSYHETALSSGFDLIANDIRPEDSGVYQCKAFSNYLSIYRTQVLCVVKKLTIETVSPTLTEYEGRSKKLTCTIRGSPAPQMSWSIQGRVLETTDNVVMTHNSLTYPYTTTLEIRNITLRDTGEYVCSARSTVPKYNSEEEWDDNVSATIVFKVYAPVTVTSPNNTVLSFDGKELVLQCTTYGEPKPSTPQWRHQNLILRPIEGVLDITENEYSQGYISTLKIFSVTLFDQGNYTCSSWNFVNINETSSVKIPVPVISPIVVSVPELVEIEHGVVEKITCSATGHPPTRQIYWFFNDLAISENIETSVSDHTVSSVITLTPSKPSDAGLYRCDASNNYKAYSYNDSSNVTAVYVAAVEIEASSQEETGVYGKTVTLTCTATGYPLPEEIFWESTGVLVHDTNIEISSSLNLTVNMLESTLVIKEVKYSNERVYNCSASNYLKGGLRTAYDFVNVTVEYPVQVRTWSNYAYNNKDKPVDVTCEIEGKPLPQKVNWYFSGQDITQSQFYGYSVVTRDNVINATLRINKLSQFHIGDYNCSASNVVDGVRYQSSRVVDVVVVKGVIVGVMTGIKNVPKGKEANLTCSGEGVPPPLPKDIQWIFKGETLPNYSLKYLVVISTERIYKITSVLRISDVQLEDDGPYTCRFSNVDKTNTTYVDEKTVQLAVQVPVEVSFNSSETVELYESESTTLTCNIFGKPPPQQVTWVRSKTGEELETDDIFDISTSNSSRGEVLTSLLTINSMSLDLEGTYECSSENVLTGGEVIRTPAFRTILRVQDVSVVPTSIAVPGIVSSLARLVCSAQGVPVPAVVTWRYRSEKQNRTIVESDRYLITHEKLLDDTRGIYTQIEGTLTINMVRWEDRGSYECSSTNVIRGEEKTSTALTTLNVEHPVAINSDTAETLQTLLGNQVGTLSVPLYGYPAPNVTWTKTPELPASSTMYIPVEEYSGVAQLTYSVVTAEHAGNYTVTATNTVHNTSYTISFHLTVEVFYPPVITMQPAREVLEMTTDKIPCLVTSDPAASHVIWYYNGSDVAELSRPSKYRVEEMVVDERGDRPVTMRNLVIKQARMSDSGQYTCKAAVFITDRLYYATATVQVSVVSAVVVSSPAASVNTGPDLEVNLTCDASGWPLPNKIIWYINGSNDMVSTSNNLLILENTISFKQLRSTIWIKRMRPDLYGSYECHSSNIVLGALKTDKAVISVFEERMEGVEKAISSKEMLIIGVLAAIILVVILGVLLLLFFRHRKKRRDKEEYERLKMEVTPRTNGADSTLKADQQRTGLIQLDPSHPDKPYRDVDYVELDPRVYKSDYRSNKFQPMPRKKRNSDYATIDTNQSNNVESRLI